MTTLADRLQKARKGAGLTQVQLAQKVGTSQNAIQKIESGQTKEPKNILALAETTGVEPKWLQYGQGEMLVKADAIKHDVAIIDDQDYSESHVEIDLYDVKLSAGNGNGSTVEWVPRKSDEPLLFRKAWFKVKNLVPKYCKAMYVRGNSMYPALEDWDTIIVDTNDTEVIDGEIYAVTYKSHFYVKQLVRNGSGISLISINTEYDPIILDHHDLEDLKIVGRKVWRGG